MIPADIDMQSLHSQLEADAIAFGSNNPANAQLEEAITASLSAAEVNAIGPVGVVVLETTPEQPAAVRDVAQDLLNNSDFETVIVRTPLMGSAVSEKLTRAQIEAGQHAMVAEPDYPTGIRLFAESAQQHTVNWPIALTLILACLALAAVVSFLQSRPSSKARPDKA